MRRAQVAQQAVISIHALREESDSSSVLIRRWTILFQSTLSVRRATFNLCKFVDLDYISIHALREESDQDITLADFTPAISIHALREESDTAIPPATCA